MWESQEIIDKLMSHASLLVSAIGHTFSLSKFAITVLVICLSFSSSR